MGATELVFIFVVYLLLFGAKGIPSLAKTMGEAVRTFRNATEDIQREILAEDRPNRDARGFSNVQQSKGKADDEPQAYMGDGPMNNPVAS